MRSSREPSEAHQTKASVQPEPARETASPPMSPAQFNALSKKRMIGVLKRVGLGKGRSKARKDVLEAAYLTWYEGRSAAEPSTGRRTTVPATTVPATTVAATTVPATTAPATVGAEVEPAPIERAPVPEEPSTTATNTNATNTNATNTNAKAAPISVAPPWVTVAETDASIDSQPASTEAHASASSAPASIETRASAPVATPDPIAEDPAPASDELKLDFASEPPPHADDKRRSGKRVHLEIDIGFRSETNFYVGFSTDLSDGGLFVATVDILPVGTAVNVYFVLPGGGDVSAEGQVAWVRQPISFNSDMYSGFGVRFTRLNRRDTAAIEHFMSLREPLFYVD